MLITERILRVSDPPLQRPLQLMERADGVREFWLALQDLLRTAFPQQHSATLFLDAKERMPGALTLHSVPAQHGADWWSARRNLTPTHAYLDRHPGIKLYSLDDVAPDKRKLRRTDFYRHVLQAEGFDKLLGLTFWEKGERTSVLCLRRAFNQPAFSAAERALLLDLHPVLDRHLRRLEKAEEETICRGSLQQFINLLPQGILLVNISHETVFANPEAFEACARWNLGAEAARCLNPRAVFSIPPAFLEAYASLMEEYYSRVRAGLDTRHPPIRTRRVHPELSNLRADLSLFSLADPLLSRPYLFVQLLNRDVLTEGPAPVSDRQVTVLSRLTPREREVALLVREGFSNEEISARLHKSLGTIKNQLQSIFAKLEIKNRGRLSSLLR